MISEQFAIDLMRENKPLMKMHTPSGMAWFVLGGGRIPDVVAEHIIARPDVEPGRDGLFSNLSQTYRLLARRTKMLTDDDTLEARECALAIHKALEGYDAFITVNALILVLTDFILTRRRVGPMTVLEDVTETLRKNVVAQISMPETEGTVH
jgi:hypothetical protein